MSSASKGVRCRSQSVLQSLQTSVCVCAQVKVTAILVEVAIDECQVVPRAQEQPSHQQLYFLVSLYCRQRLPSAVVRCVGVVVRPGSPCLELMLPTRLHRGRRCFLSSTKQQSGPLEPRERVHECSAPLVVLHP